MGTVQIETIDYCAKRLVDRAHKVDRFPDSDSSDSDSVPDYKRFLQVGNRGGTWPSVYCVFEHLIFMDLKVFKKRPSLTSIRL